MWPRTLTECELGLKLALPSNIGLTWQKFYLETGISLIWVPLLGISLGDAVGIYWVLLPHCFAFRLQTKLRTKAERICSSWGRKGQFGRTSGPSIVDHAPQNMFPLKKTSNFYVGTWLGWQGGGWLTRWELGDGGISSRIFDRPASQLNSSNLLCCHNLLCCSAELCSASLHCVVQPGNRISDTGQVGRLRDNLGLPGNSSSSFLYRVSSCLVLARIRWAKTAAVCLQSDRIAWGWNHRGKPFNRGGGFGKLLL